MGKAKGHRLHPALAGEALPSDWREHLASPSVLRRLLAQRGVSPRHQWGQNFLIDGNILRKIVEHCALHPADVVIEVGAGVGTLTRALGRAAARVVALEIDPALVGVLEEAVADLPAVTVREADALRVDWAELLVEARRQAGPGGRVKLAGNLPYYLTALLLYLWLEEPLDWDMAVVTLQKEAAERLVAGPGSRAYGALSVLAAVRGGARLVAKVSPGCFFPRPLVWSAVAVLERKGDLHLPPGLTDVLRAAFGQRRKTLLNALAGSPVAAARGEAAVLLREAGVDPGRRAEELSVSEFLALAAVLSARRSSPR
ncbi:MAG: 16S rRNA (adenine(1518)-N(6)/adenine(1519)-N(6))-dimethyltransferase RsmA [Bacillota bacterium]|nr:16S rRNA (adenine(1518)-N(6)/adenine(1519)-N(6))-dimethyltransferase RsmA [Bacillota bacterium]